MSVSQELVWLLNQLRNTPQPRERLRLLALGWRSLKGLSPTDRLRVARELGFDGAERLVEELSRRGGMSPSKLLGLLRDAETADPNRLRTMVTGLMDPDGRAEIVERLADEAADLLKDDGVIDSDEVTDAKEVGREFREDHDAVERPDEPGSDRPVIVDEDGGDIGDEPADETDSVVPNAGRSTVDVVIEPEAAHRTEQTTTEERAPETDDGVFGRSSAPVPTRPPASPDVETVLATLAAEASLIRRMAALRESADGLVDLDVADMQRLMAVFPPGWARRRALETVLRAGLPRDLQTAVATIDVLEDSGLRLWALTALADGRSLGDEDKEDLLAAAGSRLVERRLRLRLRRG
jgi:hypothetical protein